MKFSSFLILGMLLWFGSCDILEEPSKIQAPEWNPQFAAAILNTELSFQDGLDQVASDYLEVDDQGAISFVYSGKLL